MPALNLFYNMLHAKHMSFTLRCKLPLNLYTKHFDLLHRAKAALFLKYNLAPFTLFNGVFIYLFIFNACWMYKNKLGYNEFHENGIIISAGYITVHRCVLISNHRHILDCKSDKKEKRVM